MIDEERGEDARWEVDQEREKARSQEQRGINREKNIVERKGKGEIEEWDKKK